MESVLQPWHCLLACLAGWINQEQHKVIDYLMAENRILKEKFGKKRILLNDEQRRILAVKVKKYRKKSLPRNRNRVYPGYNSALVQTTSSPEMGFKRPEEISSGPTSNTAGDC